MPDIWLPTLLNKLKYTKFRYNKVVTHNKVTFKSVKIY